MKQTAVEWLVERLKQESIDLTKWHNDLIEQALEMGEHQISTAYQEGYNTPHGEGFPETGEQYYNETFKK